MMGTARLRKVRAREVRRGLIGLEMELGVAIGGLWCRESWFMVRK